MRLPHPLARSGDCCWLPRLIAKVRWYLRGDMPLSYRVAVGSRVGVDGYFLRHFQLTLPEVVAAVGDSTDDDAVVAWFLSRPTVTPDSIKRWNRLAPTLGQAGHPGRRTFQIVRWVFYPKSIKQPVSGIFEAIVQDEDLPPT